MELELQGDQELFVETTRRFLEAESPLTEVRALYDDAVGFDRDYWRRGAELGWTTMLVPDGLGGGSVSGDGLLDLVLVAEEMGRLVAPGPLLPVNVVADTLARSGTAGAAGRGARRRSSTAPASRPGRSPSPRARGTPPASRSPRPPTAPTGCSRAPSRTCRTPASPTRGS